MPPRDIDQRIQKARDLGVPDEIIINRVKTKYPDYGKKSVGGFLQNLKANAGEVVGGLANVGGNILKASPFTPGSQQEKTQATGNVLNVAKNAPGAIASDFTKLVSNPIDYAYKNPIDAATWALPVGKGLNIAGKGAVKAGKVAKTASYVVRPGALKTTGEALESTIAGKGKVPNKALEDYFGTINNPNTTLYEKSTPVGDRGKILNILKREIGNQGRTDMPEAKQSYTDIFNKKKSADVGAKWEKGKNPTSEQLLYKNISGAYSNILKNIDPEITKLQEKYGVMKKAEGIRKSATSNIPHNIAGVIKWVVLYRLANQALNTIMPRD